MSCANTYMGFLQPGQTDKAIVKQTRSNNRREVAEARKNAQVELKLASLIVDQPTTQSHKKKVVPPCRGKVVALKDRAGARSCHRASLPLVPPPVLATYIEIYSHVRFA